MLHVVLAISAVVFLITIILVVILIRHHAGGAAGAMAELAEATRLTPRGRGRDLAMTIAGRRDGIPFSCAYRPPNKNVPPAFTVTIPKNAGLVFTLRRKNFYDRLCAGLGLTRPVITGDRHFDQRFQIDTAHPGSASRVFADAQTRQWLMEMFDGAAERLASGRDGLSLTRRLGRGEPVAVADFDDSLRTAAAFYPIIRKATGSRYDDSLTGGALQTRLAAPLLVLMPAGFALWIIADIHYPPLFPAFAPVAVRAAPFWGGLAFGYILIIWLTTRHRTDRHNTAGLAMLLAWPAFFLILMGGFNFVNGFMDISPAADQPAVIREVYSAGKGGKKVRFTLDGRATAGFSRPRSGGPYMAGRPVVLTVREGYLGVPWVQEWRALRD